MRILDFPHALEHLGAVAQAVFGPGTDAASAWLGDQASALRHGRERAVLAELTTQAATPGQDAETHQLLDRTHAYLASRRAQIRYQAFAAAGYPIGSGCVESANKLVVETRLKGAGMHWARANVNPMLALRTLIANDRWAEAWPTVWDQLRQPVQQPVAPLPRAATSPPTAAVVPVATGVRVAPRLKTIVDGKPTADHPWRQSSSFRAK